MEQRILTDIAADDPLLIQLCTVYEEGRPLILRLGLRKLAAELIAGRSFKAIAFKLGLTEGTVKVYAGQLYSQVHMWRLELMRTYYAMALHELQMRIAAFEASERNSSGAAKPK